ncbi:hypothetical protein [Alysiella crassa]|uniref:Uncharacterized protein n=1 Tax=Alysiella crassa TaxID=153491 RepID=A0A376BTL7_9NEIS|nr:hypothetical protein [Alysiella crassa]UOP05768.1 hypothetical protein LVJ80_07600 [Alysiella crassa]UOP08097.1 hypothetical protein LVJ80_07280 [Alysiella crassa]SSY80178.1 Uncharacterised protein [Alysiella crassa]
MQEEQQGCLEFIGCAFAMFTLWGLHLYIFIIYALQSEERAEILEGHPDCIQFLFTMETESILFKILFLISFVVATTICWLGKAIYKKYTATLIGTIMAMVMNWALFFIVTQPNFNPACPPLGKIDGIFQAA